MAGFAKTISDQVRKDTSYHLVYPPGAPVALGDIIVRIGGAWTPVGNLAERAGIEIAELQDATQDEWEAQSTRGVDFMTKLSGETNSAFKFLTDAEAGVKISFKGEATYALGMKGVRFPRIRDIDAFWEAVKEQVPFWTWDLRRRIVTHIVIADSGTWLASASGGTSFELVAEGSIPAGGITNIADVAANFRLKSVMSAKDKFVAQSGVTPLFRAYKVKLLGGWGPAAFEAEQPKIGEVESRLTEDDGLELDDTEA